MNSKLKINRIKGRNKRRKTKKQKRNVKNWIMLIKEETKTNNLNKIKDILEIKNKR
jgi:hypothetical protein